MSDEHWVECPKCFEGMVGGAFGDDAYCRDCDKAWATDWDYTSEDSMAAWTTNELKGAELAAVRAEHTANSGDES